MAQSLEGSTNPLSCVVLPALVGELVFHLEHRVKRRVRYASPLDHADRLAHDPIFPPPVAAGNVQTLKQL